MLSQASAAGFRADNQLRELSSVDGVLEFYQIHFWSLAPSRHVGSLIIRIRSDADEDVILKSAHQIFAPLLWSLTVQFEREKTIPSLSKSQATSQLSEQQLHIHKAHENPNMAAMASVEAARIL